MVKATDTNIKDIRYDEDLRIEAYRFTGIMQKFPNHFHEYYVIGLIEVGERSLIVNNRDYTIGPGDMITFNPMDNHTCVQLDSGGLNYSCINVGPDIMQAVAHEVLGCDNLPRFREAVHYRTELAPVYRELHDTLMNRTPALEKEELFLLFMDQLLRNHAEVTHSVKPQTVRKEIEDVCAFLESCYAKRITLDELSQIAKLNKYTLIRAFTRLKGITPYRYLENVRIGKAKKMLEQGLEPVEAAVRTGFSDQSHFTSYFSQFIGLTPGQYQAIFREDTAEGGLPE